MSLTNGFSDEANNAAKYLGLGPAYWAVLFVGSMFGAGYLVGVAEIERPLDTILRLLPMILLIPMTRAAAKRQALRGAFTPAMERYNRRMLFASFGYVAGMFAAIYAWNDLAPTGIAAVTIAMLPTIPTFIMIWAMGRYLTEEKDEYIRYRMVLSALMGLGLVLTVGIFYGFLETFGLVPHVWAWWVLPVWAIGLGISQLILKVRGQ